MKKVLRRTIILLLAIGLLFAVSACSNNAVVKTFTVEYRADIGGSISGEENQTVKEGQDGDVVIAIADEGYVFLNWSDGNINQIRQDKNVRENISVVACFEIEVDNPKELRLTYTAAEGGYIQGQMEQVVLYGEDAYSIIAVPYAGYKFVKWSDGIKTATRHDTGLEKEINVIAEFDYIFEDGSGTIEKPRVIETYQQLLNIKLFPNLYYKLVNDLDLDGLNHEPLFTNTNAFSGNFDGNGFAIENMTINKYTQYPSLFGFVSGTVVNLNITDFEITVPNFNTSAGVLCVGAIAGESRGVLDNINVNGLIHGSGLTYSGVAIGGLVGQAGGAVMNCSANVTIKIDNVEKSSPMDYPFNIGGLIGVGFADIISCKTQGIMNISDVHNEVIIGGLIGYFLANEITDIFGIKGCFTRIEILNNSPNKVGGLIAIVNVLGELMIANCKVYEGISSKGSVGGFINHIICSGNTKLTIEDSQVKNDIVSEGMAAGFIYWIANNSNNIFEIINCFASGSVSANMAAGFCYISSNTKYYRCYSAKNISGEVGVAGFIQLVSGGAVEECFSSGTINAVHQAAGFIFVTSSGAAIKNCYSSSDVFATNTDQYTKYRTLICGFILYIEDSVIMNCYYSGKLSGHVIAIEPTGMDSIAADFAGVVRDSQIVNCHLLYHEDTFATDVIVELQSPVEDIDLWLYYSIEEMSLLANVLNANLNDTVWVNGENYLPRLTFIEDSK